MKTINLAIFSVLLAGCVTAQAGQAKFSESQASAVKCSKFEGETTCGIEVKGKYSAVAYISADTFEEKGITFDMLSNATTIEIQVGDFTFFSSLGDAVSYALTSSKLSAKWQLAHDVANKKPAVDTTVSVAANSKAVVIKVSGNNKASDNENFGQSMVAELCQAEGDGADINVPVSLTVDNIVFSATVTGTCKVKNKTVDKNGESFDLFSTSFKGSADYLD